MPSILASIAGCQAGRWNLGCRCRNFTRGAAESAACIDVLAESAWRRKHDGRATLARRGHDVRHQTPICTCEPSAGDACHCDACQLDRGRFRGGPPDEWVGRFSCAAPSKKLVAAKVQGPAFQSDILPIFQRNCLRCHNGRLKRGGLDLSTAERVLAGGESGPAVVPKQPAASRLYDVISSGEMPLDKKTKVSATEVETIRLWIAKLTASESRGRAVTQLSEDDVTPILLRHCTTCHNHRRRDGGLDLRTRAAMLRGGKSGPALVPGKPDKSLVLQTILAKQMPPLGVFDSGVTRPPDSDVEKLTQWIAEGAPQSDALPDVAGTVPDPLVTDRDRQFWAFQPPRPVRVPTVRHKDRVRNPIDAFILEKLEARSLTLSPEADRLTLIRRACFDLTGLPPTPDQVRKFVADPDPQAYENLINRLLASPRYGERWGRYWLDLAGYADTESRDADRENAWLYRDYVIRAFNADKPYDRFLLEQIAGDELADPVLRSGGHPGADGQFGGHWVFANDTRSDEPGGIGSAAGSHQRHQ